MLFHFRAWGEDEGSEGSRGSEGSGGSREPGQVSVISARRRSHWFCQGQPRDNLGSRGREGVLGYEEARRAGGQGVLVNVHDGNASGNSDERWARQTGQGHGLVCIAC